MRNELYTLSRIMDSLRVLDDTMPLQTLSVLLEVAKREPISINELADKTGLAQSSASRNVAALSERHWLKRPGLDLVKLDNDPQDIRKKLCTLTGKGRKVVDQLVGIISEGRVVR